jgi:pyruvate formate lyase activating enzyme
MESGLVFNVQRFSLQDGPGVRSTVFMKGCPLACAWCHNPESQGHEPEIVRMRHRCMVCGLCSEQEIAAPVGRSRDMDDVEACPTGALQAIGQETDSVSLVKALLRDRIFYDESGGGVTFSGGEPLLQAPFVIEALGLLQAEGVHTALDTCGHARWQDVQAASARADLVLYDLKLMDEERHKKATGVSNALILQNLKTLSDCHSNIWIRVPIIPGINDDSANLEATADFLRPLRGIRQVDLLPYHATGEAKFARVGLSYTLHEIQPPSIEYLETLADLFRARGLNTTIGGRP